MAVFFRMSWCQSDGCWISWRRTIFLAWCRSAGRRNQKLRNFPLVSDDADTIASHTENDMTGAVAFTARHRPLLARISEQFYHCLNWKNIEIIGKRFNVSVGRVWVVLDGLMGNPFRHKKYADGSTWKSLNGAFVKADKAFVWARLLSWIVARYARDYEYDGEFYLPSAPLSLRVNKRLRSHAVYICHSAESDPATGRRIYHIYDFMFRVLARPHARPPSLYDVVDRKV